MPAFPLDSAIADLAGEFIRRYRQLLDSLPAFPLDSATADLAGEFIRRYRQQGLILDRPDAIIGATAIQGRCVLVTYNRAHFPMPELALYSPMP